MKNEKLIVRNCKSLPREALGMSVAGNSKILNIPFKICFYNQTNIVVIYIPGLCMDSETKFKDLFDNYLDSIEINAYCKDTKRRTKAELENGKKGEN